MGFLDLFVASLMPVLKVLIITGIGLFLATERIDLLGATARKNLNHLVFYVFMPSLIGSSLADTITLKSLSTLWFMPVNILIAFAIGSVLGLLLTKITKTPVKLRGIVIGCCSAGNVGNLLLVILPAICDESDSPFGDSTSCSTYAEAYASLSMSILVVYIFTYVYVIMKISYESGELEDLEARRANEASEISSSTQPLLEPPASTENEGKMNFSARLKDRFKSITKYINIKMIMAPGIIAALLGLFIGLIGPIRKIIIGDSAPLRVLYTSASLLGQASVPSVTLIVGGNLLKGLKGTAVSVPIILGIMVVRFIALPLCGIGVFKFASHFGLIGTDSLFQFTLLIQFAVPPAMNIGTIAQLAETGQSELSVIFLWTYAVACVALTLWSAFFMAMVT